MMTDFNQLEDFAETLYADGFTRISDGEFAVAGEQLTLHFAPFPGDPMMVLVRARVLGMEDVRRSTDFAKAVLAGNFFWGGTRGATLSRKALPRSVFANTHETPFSSLKSDVSLSMPQKSPIVMSPARLSELYGQRRQDSRISSERKYSSA